MTEQPKDSIAVIHLAADYGTWACGPSKSGDQASFFSTDTTCSDCIASGSDWVVQEGEQPCP